MRLCILYFRARRTCAAVGGLLLLAIVGSFFGQWKPDTIEAAYMRSITVQIVFLALPAMAACIIGLSTASPFDQMELLSFRSLVLLRLWHLGGLATLAAVCLVLMAQTWRDPGFIVVAVRNLAGFLGLGLIAAVLIGGRLSWILPVLVATVPLFGQLTIPENLGVSMLLLWPVQGTAQPVATGIASLSFVLGAVSAIGLGEKYPTRRDTGLYRATRCWQDRFARRQRTSVNATRRLIYLYARSRRVSASLLGVLVTGGLSWIATFNTPNPLWQPFLLSLVPILPAITIAVSCNSPFAPIEQVVPTRLRGVRLAYLLVLFLCSVVSIVVPRYIIEHVVPWQLIGALLGYIGLVLIGWGLLGLLWCWLVPLSYAIVVYLTYVSDRERYLREGFPWWMWTVNPTNMRQTLPVEIGILLLGIVTCSLVRLGRFHDPIQGDQRS